MCRRKMSGCSVANRTSWENLFHFSWQSRSGANRTVQGRCCTCAELQEIKPATLDVSRKGRHLRCESTGFDLAGQNEMDDVTF